MGTLGDAGVSNSDAMYSGETGDSAFSLQYYRNKAVEFGAVLTALDTAARALELARGVTTDPVERGEIDSMLSEYDAKKFAFRTTAEAINAGAAAVNSFGGRFPVLPIPQGLGLAPLLPLAAVAAIGTAAVLISWGRDWIAGVNSRLQTSVYLNAIEDPAQKAEAAQALALADQAQRTADSSPLSAIASVVKWGALALGAYFAWRAFKDRV